MRKICAVVFVLVILPMAAFADDTSAKISEIIADLGNNKANNGREQKCMEGGTKKITIRKGKGAVTYEGIYKKCKEPGRMRDGHVQISIGG